MTKQEAAQLLDVISGLWANYRPSNPVVTAESWAAVLFDVSLDQAAEAVYAIRRRTREFPPDPGVILDTIRELTGQRYPTPDEALREIDQEIRRVGYTAGRPPMFINGQFVEHEQPSFSCDPIRQAVATVGWRSLCLATDEGQQVVRAQFLRQYGAIRDRAELHAASSPLTGPERQIGDAMPLGQIAAEVDR